MELIAPHIDFQQSYNDYFNELGDEERYPYPMNLPYEHFSHLIKQLTDSAKGKNLFENMILACLGKLESELPRVTGKADSPIVQKYLIKE